MSRIGPPNDSLWGTDAPHFLPAARRDSPPDVKAEAKKMTASGRRGERCQRVLEALRDAPRTGADLVSITHRFGARIADLRHQGFAILSTPLDGGQWLYTLTGDPERSGT